MSTAEISLTDEDSTTDLQTNSLLTESQTTDPHCTTIERSNEIDLNQLRQQVFHDRDSAPQTKHQRQPSTWNSRIIFIVSFISFIIIFYMFDADVSTARLKKNSCLTTVECFSRNPPFEDSHLLIHEFQQYLNYFYDAPHSRISKWRLIYRGTTDGMNATTFHVHCDHQGETFTIVSTTKGYLFGGYTDANWTTSTTSVSTYSPSTNAFLFSLMNSDKIPATKFPIDLQYRNYAIFNDILSGPIFGVMDRPDIGISGSIDEFRCQIHFPSVYKGVSDLSGFPSSSDCIVNEIEVFIPVFEETSLSLPYKYIMSFWISLIMIGLYESIECGYNEKKLFNARIKSCGFLFLLGINYVYGKLFIFGFMLLFYWIFGWIDPKELRKFNDLRYEKWSMLLFLALLAEHLIIFG